MTSADQRLSSHTRYILEKANDCLLQKPGTPLIIVFGENHGSPNHHSLQKDLLKGLLTTGVRFAFGYEYPHTFTEKLFKRTVLGKLSPFLPDREKLARQALKKHVSDLTWRNPFLPPESLIELFKFCLKHRISTSFNDIADNGEADDCVIDQTDTLTANLIKRYYPDQIGSKILRETNPHDSAVMALSNISMAENAICHLKRTQAYIYVQHCGLNHLIGSVCDRGINPFNKSLSAQFNERGFNVLAIIPHDIQKTNVELQIDEARSAGICVHQM